VSIRPPHLFNVVEADEHNRVRSIEYMNRSDLRMNGGFFVLRRDVFDYMRPGEELVEQPFQRLIEARRLLAYPYDGFWASMDTFKDRQRLDELFSRGDAPWAVWEKRG
jgi:glucose-1-phosphate cytidylyltransferase